MANSRIVNTNFWKDSYIMDLNPDEKLLFIYFLTNPRTTLAGVYEISLREVEFDTGLEKAKIQEYLGKFTRDHKMHFERNWLILSNFIKHQRLNPSIIRGIEKAIEELPDWLQKKIELGEDNDKQMSIFITDSYQSGSYPQNSGNTRGDDQSDNRLSTDTPQYKEIKSNLNKVKEKKGNADKSAGSFKKMDKQQQRIDDDAKQADDEQTERARKAWRRPKSKPTQAMNKDPYAFREGGTT